MLDDLQLNRKDSRILVVEDDPLVRLSVAEELRAAGYTVIEAASAEEALAYLQSGGEIDLVFTDVQMPGPLDGMGLVQQVRAAHPALPIIMTSGVFQPITETIRFISKPYDPRRIIDIIADTLECIGGEE